ncbi:Cytochrome P450 CYP2 subfamily [Handroanthus impetiginosus]|uniref:Cytochrome P450 CYP2 subfamily n=1 Tax=Handroanthus impetiginosus TaxID=429701 RepID=A0A2G9H8E9_9LAMI|nr:Cytochrome P450 CYP2 subfamily [Handroanthus impetiginosus]
MAWIWTAAISAITFLYLLLQFLNLKNKKKLPPGPIGLPILGHFHLLGKNPHQDLHRIAQKHGPIIYLQFGSVPTIIVSSPAAAELFLKTHDTVFADRPHHEASIYLGYEQRNLIFGKYGQYWRNMRKLCTMELLSNLKISQFQTMRKTELSLLVGLLKKAAETGETVDLSVRITNLSADMTCLMVFGKKYEERDLDEKGFKEVIKEVMEEAAAFNIGDYFPYLRGLDLQGSARRLKRLSKIFDGFLEKIIDEHVKNKKEKETQDFVDTMMGIMESGEAAFEFDRRHVKAVLMKARVLINAYAIGRDPSAWKDPEKFFPDRFYESNVDLRGRDFQLIPFGSGRRGCPGIQLGLTAVQLMVAQLVHCFDWGLPDGMMNNELDMSENFGLVVARAKHLAAIPSYRLSH